MVLIELLKQGEGMRFEIGMRLRCQPKQFWHVTVLSEKFLVTQPRDRALACFPDPSVSNAAPNIYVRQGACSEKLLKSFVAHVSVYIIRALFHHL
jgi:hypothetical protein